MLADKWNKNRHKVKFYLQGIAEIGLPRRFYSKQKASLFQEISEQDDQKRQALARRVNYYNQLSSPTLLSSDAQSIANFSRGKSWAYYIDMKKYLLAFDPTFNFFYMPGDVRSVPEHPTLLKSRPISQDNANSILLKLNRIRHYFL